MFKEFFRPDGVRVSSSRIIILIF
uniref:Uncharacterized protein n=1 Tax=Anguilla anguilla TaxID=7936 RepID=A0A0E9P5Q1_ANGAN